MLTLLLLSAPAFASYAYPAEVASYLGLACTPQCTICHETNSGGQGTANQPFALAMKARGLTGLSNFDLLHAALDQMTTDGVDSDGDGIIDTDALAQGMDPNTGVSFCNTLTPTYGCATAPGPAGLPGLAGIALGTAAFLLHRRR